MMLITGAWYDKVQEFPLVKSYWFDLIYAPLGSNLSQKAHVQYFVLSFGLKALSVALVCDEMVDSQMESVTFAG